MQPRFRRWIIIFAIGAASAVLSLAAGATGWLDELEWKTFDLRLRLAPQASPPPEIAIVLIDEASLRMMNPVVGRWPWPRSVHADVVDFLAAGGARVIAFDILFTENEREGRGTGLGANDGQFRDAVEAAGNVLSAIQLVRDEEDDYNRNLLDRPLPDEFVRRFALQAGAMPAAVEGSNIAYLPFPELLGASRGVGVVEFAPDRDGIYRRTRLVRWHGGHAFPVLSLASLEDRFRQVPSPAGGLNLVPVGGGMPRPVEIPLAGDGSYLLKPYRDFHAYSMSGVLASVRMLRQGEVDGLPVRPDEFQDKIVFIGASAVGVEDLKPTPFGVLQPGVFLHASIVGNILQRDFLLQAPLWAVLLATGSGCLLMAGAVLLPARTMKRIVLPALFAGLYTGGALIAFRHNLVFAMVPPLGGMALAWFASLGWLSATEGKDKRRIRRMLGQYVSPAVLEAVIDRSSEGVLRAEVGSREHLTILFSDIRGFTGISEVVEAEQVVEILNGYFSGMVDIIFRCQGTLDKFIGDAIMAFWGAPLRIEDPARRGIEAAIGMTRWLQTYNAELTGRGLSPLHIGIGLHTGPVILGNIGSEKKLDYTIIGDNVNLCSRLEGLTKTYGCGVILSETTRHEAGPGFICRVVDDVRVKGRKRPVRIYEALALPDDPAAERGRCEKLAARCEGAFGLYLAREWEGAGRAYGRILEQWPDDPLARIFVERCAHYRREEPPPDWDGVYTSQSK